MAELKTLNGYEIVDQNARDTKQNKVLYGSSDPSNSTGENGDVYIATNGVDIINDLQSQINTNKNNITKNSNLLGNFKIFGDNLCIPNDDTYTINNFKSGYAYLIIDVHINNGVAMYIASAGYGLNMSLTHIAGGKNLL